MGVYGRYKTDVRSDPDVVPFIDIILVLLVIFMVISPLNRKGFDMILPEYESECSFIFMISINSKKTIMLNGKIVPEEKLKKRLYDIYSERNYKSIYLRASIKLKYKDVVNIMDIIKEAGIKIILYPDNYEE